MKIIKFKKVSNDKYKIYLDDGKEISLFEDVIVNNNLLLTKEIKEDELEALLNQNNDVYVYQMSIRFISIRMRSKSEVFNYLLKKNIPESLINSTINKLIKKGYLDDLRFSKSYVNDKMLLSNYGPYKIRENLVKLGIEIDVINEVIESIDSDLIKEKLDSLIEKQIKVRRGSLNSLKLKLINYFVNLGYQKDMIVNELSCFNLKSDGQKLKNDYNKLYNKYKDKYDNSKLMYFIAQKLYAKGYTSDDIKSIINSN